MPDRCCVECGAPVHGQGRHLYCSDECKLITRTCVTCGEDFRAERKRRNRIPVCSIQCRPSRSWGNPQLQFDCLGCGDQITAYACQRRKYCSRSCAALHRPINGKPSKIADAAIDEFLRGTPLLCELEKRLGRWSVDLALPLQQIAVELDGEYWHGLPAMVEKDRRKDAWLAEHGWTVVRVVMSKDDSPGSIARRISEELTPCLMQAAA